MVENIERNPNIIVKYEKLSKNYFDAYLLRIHIIPDKEALNLIFYCNYLSKCLLNKQAHSSKSLKLIYQLIL